MKRKYNFINSIYRFINNKSSIENKISTIGVANYFKNFKLSDGSLVNVQIVDTSGQEKFRAINESYYRLADCALLVYDIGDEKSFKECKYYSKQIKERCKKNIQVILLGNKTDLQNKRKIPSEKGGRFASEKHYIFMETSCLKNTNVADAFTTLIEITNRECQKNNNSKNDKNSGIKISKTIHKKSHKEKKKCC